MIILFKYTSRGRPEYFFRGLDSIYNLAADKENIRVLCSFDTSDTTMNNDTVRERLKGYINLEYVFGYSSGKVSAINRDLNEYANRWDILVNMSDDMLFVEPGHDDIIRQAMRDNYPDTDGVLHFNDGYTDDRLMSLTIEGYTYYKRFDYIYHPDYTSVYCDNEALDVAKMLNKVVYSSRIIYKHLHPAWGQAPVDAGYIETESFYEKDKQVYHLRKSRNFYDEPEKLSVTNPGGFDRFLIDNGFELYTQKGLRFNTRCYKKNGKSICISNHKPNRQESWWYGSYAAYDSFELPPFEKWPEILQDDETRTDKYKMD